MRTFAMIAVLSFGLAACQNQVQQPVEGNIPSPGVPAQPTQSAAAALETIKDLAANSECAKVNFVDQGKPKVHFLKGMVQSFARTVCNPKTDQSKVVMQPIGDPAVDALAHYGLSSADPFERLRLTYSLMVGSAARESTWRWCVGRDITNDTSHTASTCEAGAWQTSYNSRYNRDGKTINQTRMELFTQFRSSNRGCFAADYKGSVTCSAENMKNVGEGDGAVFQKLSKECPGFAAEYHALMLRERRSHYGPVNRKTAQLTSQCTSMFAKVQKVVEASPGVCTLL